MSYTEFKPCGMRTFLLRVEDYESRIPRGTVENAFLGQRTDFLGVIDLITKVDAMLDKNDGEAAASDPAERPEPPHRAQGEMAVFRLDILFRQNTSWQGSVTWLEKRKSAQFRSVLELIMLVDSVLAEIAGK